MFFGHDTPFATTLEVSTLDGANGFKINGETPGDYAGRAVSAGSDFNGDGIDDFVVGAYRAGPNGPDSGASYVVFRPRIEDPNPVVTISANATKATFVDVDGDKVAVKTSRGQFTVDMFDLRAEGRGAQLAMAPSD